jgi:hypothetical protein
MWDEHDHTARWIQGICGVFLAFFAIVAGYFVYSSLILMVMLGGVVVFIGSVRLSWRCLRYAITGKGNVNRDDYN